MENMAKQGATCQSKFRCFNCLRLFHPRLYSFRQRTPPLSGRCGSWLATQLRQKTCSPQEQPQQVLAECFRKANAYLQPFGVFFVSRLGKAKGAPFHWDPFSLNKPESGYDKTMAPASGSVMDLSAALLQRWTLLKLATRWGP